MEDEFYRELGARIKAAREDAGMRQEDLAKVVGLTRVSMCNIEKGRQRVLSHTLMRLCGALGWHIIIESRIVYVATVNTDLTEGRGWQIPMAVCESETTAKRIGKGRDVQGCDATIIHDRAYRLGRNWYAQSHILQPTIEDDKSDAAKRKKDAAIAKAKQLGLSEKDIADLYAEIHT